MGVNRMNGSNRSQFDSSEHALVAAWFILGANKAPLSGVSAPYAADRFMARTIASGLKGFSVRGGSRGKPFVLL